MYKERVNIDDGEAKKNRDIIRLHKNIALLSKKGLTFPPVEEIEKLVLRQAIKIEEVKDSVKLVPSLISKVEKLDLLRHYRIADFSTPEQFLE